MKSFTYTSPLPFHLFLLFVLAICSGRVSAQAPKATLSVQGVLTKSDGTAVDDGNDYVLTFRLWDDETSTDINAHRKHLETITDVTIVGGVYSVVLGLNPSFPLNAPFDKTYWLGVSVGTSTTELLPRPRLTHAPYALGIVGQNNIFPSTGTVIADGLNIAGDLNVSGSFNAAFKADGGAPASGNALNGFSFKPGTGGDADGGLFSIADNNVCLYANATKALEASSGGVAIPGALTVNNGALIDNSQTVNGGQTVNGNGLFNNKVLTTAAGGYSFDYDGAYDSGMFGSGTDGEFSLKSNGVNRFLIGANGTNYLQSGSTVISVTGPNDYLYFTGIKPKGTTGNPRNIAIDLTNGRIFEESSSRRYKRNIRPLQEDFSLILKAQPKIYNRFEDPADIDTSKYYELGYIAEEMDSIGLHKLIQYNNEGQIDGFNYEKMILYAVEVLKIQHNDIEALKNELAALKSENAGLKTENHSLRVENGSLQQQQTAFSAQLEN